MKRLLVLCLLLAVLCVPAASAAQPWLAVKSGGQWYWSPDVAQALYPERSLIFDYPFAGVDSMKAKEGLALLSVDQKMWLMEEFRKSEIRSASPYRVDYRTGVYPPDFEDGTAVLTWNCRGSGKPIPSDRVDVDLYHRFRCTYHGAKFRRMEQLIAAINTVRDQIKATPAPVSQSLVEQLAAAYHALGAYQRHGDPVTRTITVLVDGRRLAGLVGVTPV